MVPVKGSLKIPQPIHHTAKCHWLFTRACARAHTRTHTHIPNIYNNSYGTVCLVRRTSFHDKKERSIPTKNSHICQINSLWLSCRSFADWLNNNTRVKLLHKVIKHLFLVHQINRTSKNISNNSYRSQSGVSFTKISSMSHHCLTQEFNLHSLEPLFADSPPYYIKLTFSLLWNKIHIFNISW
jgi:hypothetical protein